MRNRILWFVLVVCAVALLAPAVRAQSNAAEQPALYIYVSEWGVPRAQWDDYDAAIAKAHEAFDKLMADGTINGWGNYTIAVHEEGGMTHGNWVRSSSVAGIFQAQEALRKTFTLPLFTISKHQDFFFHTTVYKNKPGASGSGILWVSSYQVKPGHFEEWMGQFKRYIQPVLEDGVASGDLLHYSVDTQFVHSQNPNDFDIAYIAANAAALDKFLGTVRAAVEKNPAIGPALALISNTEAHRDMMARVTSFALK